MSTQQGTAQTVPSRRAVWIMAARPKALPAAAAPVIVGCAVAISLGKLSLIPALAALAAALLLQIAANFANDVFDYQKGADTSSRLGPTRVTQSGYLKPGEVLIGMWVIFGLAGILGIYLTWVAGWPILVIGGLAILSAILYTGGPYPLGYHGFGEVFVFVFFGLAAVGGSTFVQTHQFNPEALWASIPMGLLAVNILVVNNLRDIDTDRASGKHTLAVRFGRQGARLQYLVIMVLVYLLPVIIWLSGNAGPWILVTYLTIPNAWRLVNKVFTLSGKPLNGVLAGTGQHELLYGISYSIGLILPLVLH